VAGAPSARPDRLHHGAARSAETNWCRWPHALPLEGIALVELG